MPRPDEVNHHVVSRREAVHIIEELENHAASTPKGDYVDILNEFANTISIAVERILRHPYSRAELENSGHQLAAYRAFVLDMTNKGKLRSNNLENAVGMTGKELIDAWGLFKQACTTVNMREAQEITKQGQQKLDTSPAAIQAISLLTEASHTLIEGAEEVPLARRVVRSLRVANPSLTTLPELMDYGARVASDAIGRAVDPRAGLSFLMLIVNGKYQLNWDNMQQKLKEGAAITANLARLREIAEMDGSLFHLGELNRLNHEALDAFAQSVAKVESPTTLIRRLTKAITEVYENSVPLLTWFRLLASTTSGSDRYLKYEVKDATEHVSKLSKQYPSMLFADLPSYIRHLGSHGRTFRINAVEESVSIELRSHKETISYDLFVHRCLGVIESTIVAYWLLEAALLDCDIAIPIDSEDAQFMGIDPLNSIAAVLETKYPEEVSTRGTSPQRWCLRAPFTEGDSISTALTLADQRPPEVESIVIETTNSSAEPVVIPYSAILAFEASQKGSPAEIAIALLDFLNTCRTPSGSLLAESNILWTIRCFAMNFNTGTPDAIPLTRRVLNYAKQHEMKEAAAQATTLIRALRTNTIETRRWSFRKLPTGLQPELPEPENFRITFEGKAGATPNTYDVLTQ